uniref:ER membrane protein complex subunit 10 n=1 Tax=Parastrongyloides trichosuri TaxID=131310 RepID=A0A0N4ZRB7_PARTI
MFIYMVSKSFIFFLVYYLFVNVEAVPKDISVKFAISNYKDSENLGNLKFQQVFNTGSNVTAYFVSEKNALTNLKNKIQNAIQSDEQIYYLSLDNDKFITSLPLCILAESNLFHRLDVVLGEDENEVKSITLHPYDSYIGHLNGSCPESKGLAKEFKKDPEFYVQVFKSSPIPYPDTQTFVKKIEKEKQQRVAGGDGDNRSFLQKYWLYIALFVLLFVISSAANPEGQA